MADLTGKTIANGYPNLVTIGATTDDNPTTGTLENGKGNNLTSVTFDGAVVVNESGGDNDFRVEGDTDANLIVADASADKVGIGTSSPGYKLQVSSSDTIVAGFFSTSNTPTLALGDSPNTNKALAIGYNETGNYAYMQIFGDSPGDAIVIADGGDIGIGTTSPAKELDVDGEIRASDGILFGTDTAAANTLDDYEEGTWTPDLTFLGNKVGITYTTQTGSYTKIGNTVALRGFIVLSNKGSSSGRVQIEDLPFVGTTSYPSIGAVQVSNITLTSISSLNVEVGIASGTYLRLMGSSDGIAAVQIDDTDMTNTSVIIFQVTYQIS